MPRNRIRRVSVPVEALADFPFEPVHYADAFRTALPDGPHYTMPELAHHFFGSADSSPKWVNALVRLRDILVRPFNIKTADDVAVQLAEDDDRIGFFKTFQHSENEIILGEDDSHLDFRLSILRSVNGGKSYLTMSTFVRFNNWVGRGYFLFIKPFHQVIVPVCTQKAVADLAKKQGIGKLSDGSI